jgi:hypothetical protein
MGGLNRRVGQEGAKAVKVEQFHVAGGHEALAPTRKKKLTKAEKKAAKEAAERGEDGNDEHADDDSDADGEADSPTTDDHALENESVQGNGDGHGDLIGDAELGQEDTLDAKPARNRRRKRHERLMEYQKASEPGWDQEVPDSLPISLNQLNEDSEEEIPGPPDNREIVAEWMDSHTGPGDKAVRFEVRDKMIEHLLNRKFPGSTLDWTAELRQTVWRCVIRSGHFWINPDTKEPVGKPKPIRRPDGPYESDFRVFVICAAERADRIGRDLPDPEFVKAVEDQVRIFLRQAETKKHLPKLEHLAFLLVWDEERTRSSITADDLRERVKMTFGMGGLNWKGCEMFHPDGRVPRRNKNNIDVAESIWQDAMKTLM